MLKISLFIKISVKNLNKIIFWQKLKLSPFPNSFKNPKELFDLIISKISSDNGDFPRIIEIALSILYSSYWTSLCHTSNPVSETQPFHRGNTSCPSMFSWIKSDSVNRVWFILFDLLLSHVFQKYYVICFCVCVCVFLARFLQWWSYL